jgi:large subunit ribosomal protein L21
VGHRNAVEGPALLLEVAAEGAGCAGGGGGRLSSGVLRALEHGQAGGIGRIGEIGEIREIGRRTCWLGAIARRRSQLILTEVTMYAVIKTGGKQYKVAAGEKLKIEQIPADVGQEITLDQVLAVGEGDQIQFGRPLVSGATVKATVLAQGRHDKVKIFKMRRRKHYQKHQGHRQNFTEVRIDTISA